jgi:hypothetical protein
MQVLFLQEAISGTASEFRQPTGEGAPTGQSRLPEWCLVNGVWSLFLAFGLVLTALLTRQVHSDAHAVLAVPFRHCAGSWSRHAHAVALVAGSGLCCCSLLLWVTHSNSTAAALSASQHDSTAQHPDLTPQFLPCRPARGASAGAGCGRFWRTTGCH